MRACERACVHVIVCVVLWLCVVRLLAVLLSLAARVAILALAGTIGSGLSLTCLTCLARLLGLSRRSIPLLAQAVLNGALLGRRVHRPRRPKRIRLRRRWLRCVGSLFSSSSSGGSRGSTLDRRGPRLEVELGAGAGRAVSLLVSAISGWPVIATAAAFPVTITVTTPVTIRRAVTPVTTVTVRRAVTTTVTPAATESTAATVTTTVAVARGAFAGRKGTRSLCSPAAGRAVVATGITAREATREASGALAKAASTGVLALRDVNLDVAIHERPSSQVNSSLEGICILELDVSKAPLLACFAVLHKANG
eukprot:Opistho-2@94758